MRHPSAHSNASDSSRRTSAPLRLLSLPLLLFLLALTTGCLRISLSDDEPAPEVDSAAARIPIRTSMTVTRTEEAPDSYLVSLKYSENGRTIATPKLLVREGRAGSSILSDKDKKISQKVATKNFGKLSSAGTGCWAYVKCDTQKEKKVDVKAALLFRTETDGKLAPLRFVEVEFPALELNTTVEFSTPVPADR